MELIIDIKEIEKLAAEREEENWQFRTFLKGLAIEELDTLVHRIYEEVASQIDCQACGNCCKNMRPALDQKDMKRLASHFSMSRDEFKAEYLVKDSEGEFVVRKKPCPFLSGNLCSVYQDRPEACRSYPHLHKKELVFRLMGVVSNCSVCPIVFNVYER